MDNENKAIPELKEAKPAEKKSSPKKKTKKPKTENGKSECEKAANEINAQEETAQETTAYDDSTNAPSATDIQTEQDKSSAELENTVQEKENPDKSDLSDNLSSENESFDSCNAPASENDSPITFPEENGDTATEETVSSEDGTPNSDLVSNTQNDTDSEEDLRETTDFSAALLSSSSEDNEQDGNEEPELAEEDTEDMYYLHLFDEEKEDIQENSQEDGESEEDEVSEEAPEDKEYDPDAPRKIDTRFDFIELVVFTLAIVMFITSFVFRHSIVVGASMENTLYEGERLIISDLFYTPDYNDIIVFEDFSTDIRKPIVKRVIALENDTVKITEDTVYVNGEPILEGYVFIDEKNYEYEPLEIQVPPGKLFVMGDHRNESTDSRDFGCISEDSVLGVVLVRFYPIDRFGKVD